MKISEESGDAGDKGEEMEDVAWLKMKYHLLQRDYDAAKARNEELEERMLSLVDHFELESQNAEEKIKQLTEDLTAAVNKATSLEEDCAKYKKDCLLAVHLLHCQPSKYVLSLDAPEIGMEKAESNPQNSMVVRGCSTFPPMAVYLPEDDSNDSSEEDRKTSNLPPLQHGTSELKPSLSFTSQFIEKIKNDEGYSCVELRKCEKSSTVLTTISRETQTSSQSSRPKIVDLKEGSFNNKGVVHIV